MNALAGIANDTRYIQVSTPIQPGNSGGPIVDKDGMLLGVTTATLSKDLTDKIDITAQNVNFAIRSSVVEAFLQSQGINYQQLDRQTEAAPLSTADLAEKVSPSVFPVACYGQAAEEVNVATPEANTNLTPIQIFKPTLIDANGYDAVGYDYQAIKNVTYYSCKSACANDGQCPDIHL